MDLVRRSLYYGINWAFRNAPNSLGYWQHRVRRSHRLRNWRVADYYIIHVPKTGGQSIAEALGRESPGHFVYSDLPAAFRERLRERPHVAVIRCPQARVRSIFRYAAMLRHKFPTTTLAGLPREPSLSAFIKSLSRQSVETHYFLRPAVGFFKGAPFDRLHLIPFDHIQAGIDQLHDQLGIPRIALPHKNRTEKVVQLDLVIDEEAEALLRTLYRDDFELYEAIKDTPVSLAASTFRRNRFDAERIRQSG